MECDNKKICLGEWRCLLASRLRCRVLITRNTSKACFLRSALLVHNKATAMPSNRCKSSLLLWIWSVSWMVPLCFSSRMRIQWERRPKSKPIVLFRFCKYIPCSANQWEEFLVDTCAVFSQDDRKLSCKIKHHTSRPFGAPSWKILLP